jgi:uncharacterized protein (DUF3820 family)
MFMKFGKFKNQPVKSLPTEYIEWFCGAVSGCDDIKHEMQRVLLARWNGMNPPPDKIRTPKPERAKSTPVTQREFFPVETPAPLSITLVPWDGVSAPF